MVWRPIVFIAFFAIGQLGFAAEIHGKVVGVTDGDTKKVLDDQLTLHKIRLNGIDAPEKAQAFGQKSKRYLSSLVFNQLVLVETKKRDRYGREIGKVILNGRDVNLEIVVAGLAWHYKKYRNEQALSDRLLYAQAEREARRFRRGLWSELDPTAPWDHRSKKRSNQTKVKAEKH